MKFIHASDRVIGHGGAQPTGAETGHIPHQAGGWPELAPESPCRRVFPGDERQLRVLRRWLESVLPDCPARDDVTIVASELGTNAVRHSRSGRGGWFAVEITWLLPVVRVAVQDGGAPTGPHLIDDPAGEHGRGLLVVRGLSLRVGISGDHQSRVVWADLPWECGGAGAEARRSSSELTAAHGQPTLVAEFRTMPACASRPHVAWLKPAAWAGGRRRASSALSAGIARPGPAAVARLALASQGGDPLLAIWEACRVCCVA